MKSSKRKICQILALVLSGVGASAAMAVPVVQGGGSSLVAPTIGAIGLSTTEIGLFGTSEGSFTYYSVGSGAGQNAFLGNQPTFLGTGVTGTVDFANSDAALNTTQITSYQAGLARTSGPLIQIPYIVTPITIPLVNAPAVTSTTTPQTTPGQAHSIALNDDDLCGIFSGNFTDWSQVTDPEKTTKYPAGAIKVVYRADSSGTSELLTRHLAAVCAASSATKPGITFVDSLTFAASFPSGVPSNFVGATGSGGVKSQLTSYLAAGTAAVAYLSPDYTNTFLAPSSSSASSQLQVASLLNAKNGLYYAPTAGNATTALSIAAPGTKNAASQPANWVPIAGASYTANANPASGYPVSGTSQILVSQCYADPAVKTAVHDFLNNHYTNSTFATVIRGNGFDTVPSSFQTAISNDFLSNASGWNLDIGNAGVCTGTITGR
ncbi:substrate-binding domain-containing protein [Paraburkholderia sp. BCC1876]|uniref:substrate-binding domain-containing protein n=1 Tax=Paraburkholderia sp. BCC1876 TaxID=2676303 RepID=UPI001590BC86|nr:substrate-binding domain-containing protein [Paraburkholderia sp. BCC1876]